MQLFDDESAAERHAQDGRGPSGDGVVTGYPYVETARAVAAAASVQDPSLPPPTGVSPEEQEVRDALLHHEEEREAAWIFAQLDAAEARYRERRVVTDFDVVVGAEDIDR